MAINRPTTKTVISTTAWGFPITDEVNALRTELNALKPTAWTGVTFSNGWADYALQNYELTQYRKVGDVVQLRGTMKGTNLTVPAFTLPAGFRPLKVVEYSSSVYAPPRTMCGITINTSGQLIIYDAAGNVSITGLWFSTI